MIAAEAWRETTIDAIAARSASALATGPFGSAISSRFFRAKGVPVIRGGNLSSDPEVRLRDDDLVYLDLDKAAEFSRSTVRAGDLIFTSWGTINQVGLIDESSEYSEYVISNKQMKLTVDASNADPRFLYYLFSAPPMQQEILDGAIGSSVPGFNLARLRSLSVRLPPLDEQLRIVSAITEADELARHLVVLIAKKRDVKQGMMQVLLTGKARLPGFSSRWRHDLSLGELCVRSSGYWGSIARTQFTPHRVRVITAGDIDPRGNLTGAAERYFSDSQLAKARCRDDDIVITSSGNGLGKTAYIHDPDRLVASNFVRILRPRIGVSGAFLSQVMHLPIARTLLDMHTATSAYPNLLPSFYEHQWVQLPGHDEQLAIAQVLADADEELGALLRRLASAREVRVGMMQELLTGHTRLPVGRVGE